MTQSIILTGPNSEGEELNILWYDHNNIRHGSRVRIGMMEYGLQRTLYVEVNEIVVSRINSSQLTKEWAEEIGRLV
jgi:hypothetical protein